MSLAIIEVILVLAYLFRHSMPSLFVILIFSIIVLGFANIQLKANHLSKSYKTYDDEKFYITGRVKGIDYNYRGMPRLMLSEVEDFDGNKIGDKVRVSLMSKKGVPSIGSCVEMVALFRPPLQPVMVGGYQFNRKYFFEGLNAVGSSASRALETECKSGYGIKDRMVIYVADMRQRIVARIAKILPEDQASITSALVAGEKGLINNNLYNNYRDSGLAHFLSISGLHMSMIAGLMFFMVRLVVAAIPPIALRYDGKKISAVFAIIMSFVYLLISGAEIPAQRAFIMTTIVLIGVLVSRRAISIKTISWAALIILIISPQALIGASFQMSFAAVVCLIAFYERYASSLSKFLN
ncbi:MAG: ComEC/Rec2 family competence protein, partial [Lactobacillus sp.]|nr:ComEC/Rec2 family competence protein [Lactobacillus sp.]